MPASGAAAAQDWRARLAARGPSRLVSATAHAPGRGPRVSTVRSRPERLRMSLTSCASSGKAISTQPTTSGAFTGTSTAW